MITRYTLLSGETLELPTPSVEVGAFLRRVLAVAEDPAATEAELTDLVHGPENPLLDRTIMVERPVATAEVYRNPLFHVMLDCIARRRRARSAMTVAEAAAELGVTQGAVRQAIYSGRLRAEKVGKAHVLDSQSVAELRVGRRGPRRRETAAMLSPGRPLDARIGTEGSARFQVKHPRQKAALAGGAEAVWAGRLPGGWRRLGVLATLPGGAWFWEIEPARGESVLEFEGFFLRGGLCITASVSRRARAASLFDAFVAM